MCLVGSADGIYGMVWVSIIKQRGVHHRRNWRRAVWISSMIINFFVKSSIAVDVMSHMVVLSKRMVVHFGRFKLMWDHRER